MHVILTILSKAVVMHSLGVIQSSCRRIGALATIRGELRNISEKVKENIEEDGLKSSTYERCRQISLENMQNVAEIQHI